MRRLTAAFAAALILCATAPASAASLSGMGAAIHGSGFNFDKANLDKAPVGDIAVGPLKVKLQTTRLVDVQKALGGTLQNDGGGTSGATWLCYNGEGFSLWFIANALGGQEFVMMVAAEATRKAYAGCDAAPAGLVAPDFGIPGLGAPSAELKARFGAAPSGKAAFRSDRPGGYSNIAQYIGYVMKGGKVAGIGVGETSVPTEH